MSYIDEAEIVITGETIVLYAVWTIDELNYIFVSPSGNDEHAGSSSTPKLTIQSAIATASAAQKSVKIAEGTYLSNTINLVDGVSLLGGYNANTWVFNPNNISEIVHNGAVVSNRIVAVSGLNISTNTYLKGLTIRSQDAAGSSVSNYGMHLINSPGIRIVNCIVTAGSAGVGNDGASGSPGAVGNNGASPLGTSPRTGGLRGSSSIGKPGGAGGDGRGGFLTTAEVAKNGTSGGTAGAAGANGSGQAGGGGLSGPAANSGSHGPATTDPGSVVANYWQPSTGAAGNLGTHGNGGGGGGSGNYFDSANSVYFDGNGGGGGGSGGARGLAGSGAKSGGGSFGLFLVNSTGIIISNSVLTSGNGGNGGIGGVGGSGGQGGIGASGGTLNAPYVNAGGKGGNGSRGGNGGHGASGAGGPSYALYSIDTIVSTETDMLTSGAGGTGGSAASFVYPELGQIIGNSGSNGPAGPVN